jgi:hypothetical protein
LWCFANSLGILQHAAEHSCTFPFFATLGKRIFLLNTLFPHAPEDSKHSACCMIGHLLDALNVLNERSKDFNLLFCQFFCKSVIQLTTFMNVLYSFYKSL